MSPRYRRLLAWSFTLVFIVVASFVVVAAAGLNWGGWHQGFNRSGVIVISSSPRAMVIINGTSVGMTPKRMNRVAPGLVEISLQAENRTAWTQTVRVVAGQATVIGPVTLFPLHPTTTSFSTSPPIVRDDEGNSAWRRTLSNGNVTLTQIWPGHTSLVVPLDKAPDRFAVSPHRRVVVAWTENASLIATPNRHDAWSIPSLDRAWWLSSSDDVVYGLHDGQLDQFDTITRTITPLGPVTQAGPLHSDLWRTMTVDGTTRLEQFSTLAASTPRPLFTCRTACQATSGPDGRVIVRETDGHTSIVFRSLVNTIETTELGQTDRIFWTDANEPPLWTTGAELWTLDANRQPKLLDRRAVPILHAAWSSPNHLVMIDDGSALTILSVSIRQGRGMAWSVPYPDGFNLAAFGLDRRSAFLIGPSADLAWRW